MPRDMRSVEDGDDRVQHVPKHSGPNVFPNCILLSRLVRRAFQEHLIAIKDLTDGYTVTYAQLLSDVLHLRNVLRARLNRTLLERIDRDEEVLIALLGPAGYEYTVGFFALYALGAVIVPISPDLPVYEAQYFAKKSRAAAVLTAQRCVELGNGLEDRVSTSTDPQFRSIMIKPHIFSPCLAPHEIQLSSDAYVESNSSGLVIFTSGTTGPPKGAVRRRGFLHQAAITICDQFGLSEGDTVLHMLPVHHATGITTTILPFLYCGGCIEFRSGGFNVAWAWERLRKCGITHFSGVPTMYMRMMQYYEQKLSRLEANVLAEYVGGLNEVRVMLCGTSALSQPLQRKWTRLRKGKSILTRYGGTEFSTTFSMTPWTGSVGEQVAGVDVKLSNGDEGEVLTRSPLMFSKYLFDRTATKAAHDENGYYKTGDIARREGKFYFILGRASVDIIKSGGYKISALDIEREILGLEYVSEVMVVGVDDEEFGQRVAAAIVVNEDVRNSDDSKSFPNINQQRRSLTLETLRQDLRDRLAGYKMPTLLRVVPELRKNVMGKVMKKALTKEVFPPKEHHDLQRWRSKHTLPSL